MSIADTNITNGMRRRLSHDGHFTVARPDRHQAWADAAHWRVIVECEAARDDNVLRSRLHHIHLVQRMFTWSVGDRDAPPPSDRLDDFPSLDALLDYAKETHSFIDGTVAAFSDERLKARVAIPFVNAPLELSVAEAMTQCAMHSQWHRGQNATRLRELGAIPPTVDLIVWYMVGRPHADWTR